jgi:sec-independent protein translocase protein TatA
MFGNLGFTEIAILVLILVLFFGAKRIPEIGASIGKGIKEFKRGLSKDDSIEPPPPPPVDGATLPPNQTASGSPKRLSQ